MVIKGLVLRQVATLQTGWVVRLWFKDIPSELTLVSAIPLSCDIDVFRLSLALSSHQMVMVLTLTIMSWGMGLLFAHKD